MKLPFSDLHTIRADRRRVWILDQTRLPYAREELELGNLAQAAHAIAAMQVRGAPLIGATAAYGVALAMAESSGDAELERALAVLAATRPTAVNLHWALRRMAERLRPVTPAERLELAWREAEAIADEDRAANARLGEFGLGIMAEIFQRTGRPVQVMTHCNAGWLATVAWGTALAPVYHALAAGLPVHVWVSETRPRNQGLLTAWELAQAGVPHTLMADNSAGHIMSRGAVDVIFVGADRVAANGDAANKVGTSLKAYAARYFGVPFYVVAPESTVDRQCPSGQNIPIEERSGDEVRRIAGLAGDAVATVDIVPPISVVTNPAFDVTPAAFITGIITENGIWRP